MYYLKAPLSAFFIIFSLYANAQVKIPLENDPLRDVRRYDNARIEANGDTVEIPFFDDFSQSAIFPDPGLWEPYGGTYINNRYAINPPTINAASFDGLDHTGNAYSASEQFGETDKLVSRPIQFGNFPAKGDSSRQTVYISFFWQPAGHLEVPDSAEGDRLELQLKNQNNQWETLWAEYGDSSQPFQIAIERIPEQFLYDGFQFRFQCYGNRAGFDGWHVDYIYLNKGRDVNNIHFEDQSFGSTPTSILKDYLAMPYNQFKAGKDEVLADSVFVHINNLDDIFNSNEYFGVLQDCTDNAVLDTIVKNTFTFEGNTFGYEIGGPVNNNIIPAKDEPFTIANNFEINGDKDFSGQGYIDFTQNNRISFQNRFKNYYAYDDGTAETGFGLDEAGGDMAVEYTLYEPDTLWGIGIALVNTGPNMLGNTFVLKVWKELDDNNDPAYTKIHTYQYYSESIIIDNDDSTNALNYYQLEEPLYLDEGTFYLGFQNTIDRKLPIGWDENNDATGKTYGKTGVSWYNFEDVNIDDGTLMMRPYFKRNPDNVISAREYPGSVQENTDAIQVYPNPAKKHIHIEGNFNAIALHHLNGKRVYHQRFKKFTKKHAITLNNYHAGMYILKIKTHTGWNIKKVIIDQ